MEKKKQENMALEWKKSPHTVFYFNNSKVARKAIELYLPQEISKTIKAKS